jgi:hypothetical protein
MKKINKKQIKATAYVASMILLVVLGVVGTLQYQMFINGVKAQGVSEYKLAHCDKYYDKNNKNNWLECE